MEIVIVREDPALFDAILADSLPEGQDLSIVVKPGATLAGDPAALVTFSVQLPDGRLARAQAATTLRALGMALAACRGMYERLTGRPL